MKQVIRLMINQTLEHQPSKQKNKIKISELGTKEKIERQHQIKQLIFILLGVASATIGLRGFLLPNNFIDGGITGISLIAVNLTGFPLSVFLIVINLPFILLASKTIDRTFAIKSIITIALLAISVHIISIPVVTTDKLLISVFGGFFLGLGIGLSIRGGSVLDGTEVLAIYASKKTGLTIGDIISLMNVIIFIISAFVFQIEIAMYAMITYLVAAKTVNYVVDGIEEYIGVTIVSDKHEQIKTAIIEKMGRGCTIYKGKGGYSPDGNNKDHDIVYTLITRLELAHLQAEIDLIDPNAFIVMHAIKDAKGGMIKKK